ncbi:hypothetical protein JAAARDRAFT_35946 [Jaapia argillacea MUCL 33604]|uniref:PIN domain-like protein n=1 Tax=Jaapia argillacea MUCL 33604 TaxID=933084 RepID=A0A067PR81_9AGAM|nr:hypothetical protein JAAARDRAFT_35946 [Jaapia argillacea MUCL 33604]
MGVHSLWDLLVPVGRPVLLETMEGKSMAIDSSIWIYQFQATMRDKEGRGLVNAHVLGFLRRISKLLFYGIKPVFVFDGGAPALKRSTLAERKKKKLGAAESHARVAEKLLAAQMRREALNHAKQPKSSGQNTAKYPTGPTVVDEGTVYLEDIDPSVPRTPKKKGKAKAAEPTPKSSGKKKPGFHDHDPYNLPDMDLQEAVSRATRTTAPDPRLATEEELRTFIEEMRPEDFDINSPGFRELPTEIQYEIIGDLRLKSRQTSYERLQNMLRNAPTPLDFSRAQIKNLKQRNSLTQQLLTTTDTIGKAHIAIPIRIASERNRQYVLVKNEGVEGGWVLGIRDEGTELKPIEIDHENEVVEDDDDDDDGDMDMEEVDIPQPLLPDPDLQEYRRGMALASIAKRQTPQKLRRERTPPPKKPSKPLFNPEVDEELQPSDVDEDTELSLALQESLDHAESADLQRALEASRSNMFSDRPVSSGVPGPSSSSSRSSEKPTAKLITTPTKASRVSTQNIAANWRPDDIFVTPSRLATALSIGNVVPTRDLTAPNGRRLSNEQSSFGKPTLLLSSGPDVVAASPEPPSSSGEDMEDVILQTKNQQDVQLHASIPSPSEVAESDDADMEEVALDNLQPMPTSNLREKLPNIHDPAIAATTSDSHQLSLEPEIEVGRAGIEVSSLSSAPLVGKSEISPERFRPAHQSEKDSGSTSKNSPPILSSTDAHVSADEEPISDWSRSPSPTRDDDSAHPEPSKDTWDAAQEMDATAEEGEFVRFVSQIRGRDLDDVRDEIDAEIKALNQQKKVAMRDSEDITQQMIAQIMMMLRLFGIPYITAPMEAEAQCAELVQLGLVDGIITDDSDVFLFGGQRVFKNMFNQSKTVECFLLADLARELGLDRDKLIRLAYLLGSDYVDGLPRVGPVVAMELLAEFPGEDGLHKFQDWWAKVQMGKDSASDTKSKFRKRFKKRFKDLYLSPEWPNPAVRDAYYHPTVDSSDEPFKWGLPDLDALRGFLHEELGWGQAKVDDLLLPIIQRVGKRGQAAAVNRQGNLTEYFDVSSGSGTFAPRKRQAYSSKRLQEVVNKFRADKSNSASASASPEVDSGGSDEEPPKKKRKNTTKAKGKQRGGSSASIEKKPTKRGASRGRGRGRGGQGKGRGGSAGKNVGSNDSDEFQDVGVEAKASPPPLAPQLRPRPKPAYKGKPPVADDPVDVDET